MFGLNAEKKGEVVGFDLEKDLRDNRGKANELKKLVQTRSEAAKTALRQGGEKQEFNEAEILLQGYTALGQVVEKAAIKQGG